MPAITITERDLTTSGSSLAEEHVVYIPGFSTNTLGKELVGVPTLFTTTEDFIEKIGATPKIFITGEGENKIEQADKSYVMAYELLQLGLHVLYEVPAKTLGGTDAVTTDSEIETALGVEAFWTRLKDRGLYNIRFITSGAYALDATTVIGARAKLAGQSGRGDAVALVDHAESLTEKSAVQKYFDTLSLSDNAKFSAGFTPWVHISSSAFKGSASNTLPGSFAYLVAFAQSVKTNSAWKSIAGATRGRIPGLVEPYVTIKYGELEANDFQSRTKGAVGVNPICNINPFGYIIWGNRTLLPAGSAEIQQDDLVAGNFLNIRLLTSMISKQVFSTSRNLTFEQNDDILWINYKAGITPLLEKMVKGSGIANYRLLKKKPTKKATLDAVIRITPIEAVEDFNIVIEMSDSTVSVEVE